MIWFCTGNENEEEPGIIEIVDPDAEVPLFTFFFLRA